MADIIDDVAEDRIGHREAIERLGLESYPALLDTMRANGRSMWAHRAAKRGVGRETLEILRLACDRSGEDGVASDPPDAPR